LEGGGKRQHFSDFNHPVEKVLIKKMEKDHIVKNYFIKNHKDDRKTCMASLC
jgi:hypothetical protein